MTESIEQFKKYVKEKIENHVVVSSDKVVDYLVADFKYYFTNNVESYNKALEEENEFLTEQLKTVLEKFQASVNDTQEVLSDVNQAMTLRVMGGK